MCCLVHASAHIASFISYISYRRFVAHFVLVGAARAGSSGAVRKALQNVLRKVSRKGFAEGPRNVWINIWNTLYIFIFIYTYREGDIDIEIYRYIDI